MIYLDMGLPMVYSVGKLIERGIMKMPDAPSKIRWDRENTFTITIKFQKKSDQDCIDFLEGKNKRDTICAALRYYMEHHKEGEE